MPPRALKDPDLKFFAENLQHRSDGAQYLRAWNEQNYCLKQVRFAFHSGSDQELETARRAYIKSSDRCAKALTSIQTKHSWPP